MELDASTKTVDENGLSPVKLAEDEERRGISDCDLESVARVASPEELDDSLMVEDEEIHSPDSPDFPPILATSLGREPEHPETEGDY